MTRLESWILALVSVSCLRIVTHANSLFVKNIFTLLFCQLLLFPPNVYLSLSLSVLLYYSVCSHLSTSTPPSNSLISCTVNILYLPFKHCYLLNHALRHLSCTEPTACLLHLSVCQFWSFGFEQWSKLWFFLSCFVYDSCIHIHNVFFLSSYIHRITEMYF